MPSFVPLGSRARVAAALLAAAACVAAAIAGVAACLTAPPPDIGASTDQRPEIIHIAVQPPEGLLDGWPPANSFLVPVRLPDPNATCQWQLLDQDLDPALAQIPRLKAGNICDKSIEDGGIIVQGAPVGSQPTDGHCHVFTFIVAHNFSPGQLGVADNIGGDAVSWEFLPAGALCNFYDAGAFQDGAFPPVDAGLPITPESGPIPDSGVDP